MFRVKRNGIWQRLWSNAKGLRSRHEFFVMVEEITASQPQRDVWVIFQKDIKSQPNIFIPDEFRWLICQRVWDTVSESGDIFCKCQFDSLAGAIPLARKHIKDGERFAVLGTTKMGADEIYLLTVVKDFREADFSVFSEHYNEEGTLILPSKQELDIAKDVAAESGISFSELLASRLENDRARQEGD